MYVCNFQVYAFVVCVCFLGLETLQHLFTMYFALCAYYAHALARIADSTRSHT